MSEDVKVCNRCMGEPKPLSDFYPKKGMTDGHLNACKKCTIAAVNQRRELQATVIGILQSMGSIFSKPMFVYMRRNNNGSTHVS